MPGALVKICGLSTPETLAAAVKAGADYVGLVHFEKSPRHLSMAAAARLARVVWLVGGFGSDTSATLIAGWWRGPARTNPAQGEGGEVHEQRDDDDEPGLSEAAEDDAEVDEADRPRDPSQERVGLAETDPMEPDLMGRSASKPK